MRYLIYSDVHGNIDALGFRGTRFNMVSAGGTPPDALEGMAAKLAEEGYGEYLALFEGRDAGAKK